MRQNLYGSSRYIIRTDGSMRQISSILDWDTAHNFAIVNEYVCDTPSQRFDVIAHSSGRMYNLPQYIRLEKYGITEISHNRNMAK